MSSSVAFRSRPTAAAFRSRRALQADRAIKDPGRRTRRMITVTWFLLLFNTLTFYTGISFIHIPGAVGKGIAQSSLPIAFLLALAVNRRQLIRPNVFLCIVSLLVIGVLITTIQPQHLGTVYRTFRLALFIATLWLLTPWWGRRDMLLVRSHIKALSIALGSVLVGLVVSPGHALVGHRLTGALWPIVPTQVAHYAAVLIGMTVVLWFCGELRSRNALLIVIATGLILILTHTRTALAALVAGILVAGLSLLVAKARVRKLFMALGVVVAVAVATLSQALTGWLTRGQNSQQLYNLTGRTSVWTALVSYPRNKFQEIFGFGLSNSSFDGRSIDSNWLASYQEQGLFGVAVCVAMLLFLIAAAYFQPRGVQRALALFLIIYCLIASFTEVGFTDASPYLLDLTLAASLLVPSAERSPEQPVLGPDEVTV
jgi:O-antigen ligase